MKQQIILSEYSEHILPIELTDDDRLYLQNAATITESRAWEKRFYVDELRNGVRIKTVSFVGIIELSSCQIVIMPKFNNGFDDVMSMLAFSEGLPFSMNRKTSANHAQNDLFILLAHLFLEQAESILLRLKKDYIQYREDSTIVRGLIVMLETARKHYLVPKGVICDFDELTTDILENQIILTVLHLIQRHPKFKLNRQLIQLIHQFEMLCQAYTGGEYPNFYYNRMNHQYEGIHKIGKYIFKGQYISQFNSLKQSFMTVLIDMNDLFEKFVATLLKKYLPKHFEVLHGNRIKDAITINDKPYRHIIPDIVVRNKQTYQTIVIDTKYKHYGNKKVETSDIFQLTFYAQYFNSKVFVTPDFSNPFHAKIIYPEYVDKTRPSFTIETNKSTVHGLIAVESINIEKTLHYITTKQTEKLNQLAQHFIAEQV